MKSYFIRNLKYVPNHIYSSSRKEIHTAPWNDSFEQTNKPNIFIIFQHSFEQTNQSNSPNISKKYGQKGTIQTGKDDFIRTLLLPPNP